VPFNTPFKHFQVPANQSFTEKIPFTGNEVVIPWSPLRRMRFGDNPKITLWVNDGAIIYEAPADIQPDIEAPNQTQYTVRTGADAGYIQINP
jgi:hypothetical protein